MESLQWLSKLLLIVFIARLSTCFHFFPKGEFLGAPITSNDIDKMLLEEAEGAINHRGNPGKRSIQEGCFDKAETDGFDVYTVQEGDTCRHTVDIVLMAKASGATLEDLTAGYFNGLTYEVSSFKERDGKLFSIDAEAPVPVPLLKLALGSADNPSTLSLELGDWEESGDKELSFKGVAINVEGKSRIKVKEGESLPYDIDTEIEKPEDSEDFEIKKFDFTGTSVKWLELLGMAADKMNLPNVDIVSKIGEELEGFTGFGAFNANKDYQFGIVAEGELVKKIEGAKKLTILLSQNHLEGAPDATIFLEFDQETQLISGIANLISDSGIDNSFLLSKVKSGKWCILIVTGTTTYMKPIKSRLKECLGSTKDTLELGAHFYVEIDFKEVLEACGNSESEVENIATDVGIYATINSKGVNINLPNGVETPLALLMKCGSAVAKNIPEFLGTSMVKLTDVDINAKEGLLKLAVEVSLSDKYNTIPGTLISINKFTLEAERKADEESKDKYWDISATGEIQVGQANFDLSLTKEKSTYNLKLSVDQLTFADLRSMFNFIGSSEPLQNDVFRTLGFKDFSIDWSFGGGGPLDLSIRGTPLIFGYDKLEFHAVIKSESPDAARRSIVKKVLGHSVIMPKERRAKRIRRASSTEFALGVFMDGANFNSILSTFTGEEETSMCWLNDLKAVVVVSTTSGKMTNGKKEDEEEEESEEDTTEKARRAVRRRLQKTHKLSKVSRRSNTTQPKAVIKRENAATNGTNVRALSSDSTTHKDEGEEEEEEDDSGIELIFPRLGDDFADATFDVGLTIGAAWRIPESKDKCGPSNLCQWMVDNLGSNFVFTLKGNVAPSSIKIEGKLEGYAVFKKTEDQNELALTSVSLVIDGKSVRLEVTMQYKDKDLSAWENPLIFKGSIEATPTEIKLQLSMENYIYPTSISAYVAIGNTQLGIGYVFGAPLPALVFGATIKLGKLDPKSSNDDAMVLTGHFGANPGDVDGNWFYVSVSELTVGKICTTFELECDGIPEHFRNSGFPSGLTASFSTKEREVEGVATIPQGLELKGTIDFMGYECKFDVVIGSSEFKLKLEMGPINWAGGMIMISRSSDDSENGPMADIVFAKGGEFSIQIEGHCTFLSLIKVGVNIQVDNDKVKFELEGTLIPRILDLVFKVEATYGESADMLFSFEATLKSNDEFQEMVLENIEEFLTQIKDKIGGVIKKAEDIVARAKDKLEDARQKVKDWDNSIDEWKKKLEERKAELEIEANKSPPCDCPKVCFPFMDWNPECWQAWGSWVGCPCSNPCFSMVEDAACYLRCTADKVVSTLVRWSKQAVLDITMLVSDGARSLVGLAHGIVSIAEGFHSAAQRGLDMANEKVKWAFDAAMAHLRELKNNFKLHHLTVSASLTADYSACVGYDISLTFMVNVTNSGQACLDPKNFIKSIVSGVADGADAPIGIKGISASEDPANEAEGLLNESEETEKQLDQEESKVNSKVNEEVAKEFKEAPTRNEIPSLQKWKSLLDALPKVHTVPSKEDMEIVRLAREPIPSYDMSEDPDLRSFDTHAPWTAVDVTDEPLGYNATATPANVKEKRELNFGDKLSPCGRMKRALKGYSQLTDGLIAHTKSFEEGAVTIITGRTADKEFLRNARSKIEASANEHNMTAEQRENAFYLYRKAAKGYEELSKKAKVILKRENSFALPVIRRQLNTLLNREKRSSFLKFTEHMHANAIRGYKRSFVPHPADTKGEELLASINKEIRSIVTDENSGLISMSNRVRAVKSNIAAMAPYTKQCEK